MLKKVLAQIAIIFFGAVASNAASLQNVVIISIDALHPAALNAETTPTIYREMRQGAYTLDGRSTNPPKTLISHTAMLTGLGPDKSGRLDNQWQPGEPTIECKTIFNSAKQNGFQTGFYYSKQRLGYLVNEAVDVYRWSRDDAIDLAEAFVRKEYLEELSYIDEYLAPLIISVKEQKNYLIIITSDHAGHDKIHGSQHPEDYKLPFIINSDTMKFNKFQNIRYSVTDLKNIVDGILK